MLFIVVALTFAGGYAFGISRSPQNVTTTANLTVEKRDAITQVWDYIFADYVDQSRVDSANLSRSAIEGMLQALNDPYTSYLSVEEYALSKSDLQGNYTGIGAYVTVNNGQFTIIAPIAGSPAEKAGIKAGDIVLEIDGKTTTGMSLPETIIKVRGPSGTSVKLLVLHEGDTQPVEIEVIRTTLEMPSVHLEMKGEIAHITINEFIAHTADQIGAAIKQLTDAKAKGIILDLRGNPGGLLDEVVDVASFFLSEGVVVQVRSNQGKMTTLNVNKNRPTTNLPMVVLVDKSSASGSEVLSGALQDRGRATIAGTTTYGKGSVDVLYPLSDGSGLYITISRWLTPNGRLIEGQGIKPDIEPGVTGEEEVQWAINYLTKGGG